MAWIGSNFPLLLPHSVLPTHHLGVGKFHTSMILLTALLVLAYVRIIELLLFPPNVELTEPALAILENVQTFEEPCRKGFVNTRRPRPRTQEWMMGSQDLI